LQIAFPTTNKIDEVNAIVDLVRTNYKFHNLCKYPPYNTVTFGSDPFANAGMLSSSCSGLNSYKSAVASVANKGLYMLPDFFMNSLWAGDLRATLQTSDDPQLRQIGNDATLIGYLDQLDILIAEFESGQTDFATLATQYDTLAVNIDSRLFTISQGQTKDGIPAIELREGYEQYYDWIIHEMITAGIVNGENYVSYFQVENEITVPQFNIGDPDTFTEKLQRARNVLDNRINWHGSEKTLLVSAGSHSSVPPLLKCIFDPESSGFVELKYGNGEFISLNSCDGAENERTYLFTKEVLDNTGVLNDVIDLHIYRNPVDALDYEKIVYNYLRNPDWNNGVPRLSEDPIILGSEYDGPDRRVDIRFFDSPPSSGTDWSTYNDYKYRVYQTEDVISREGASFFSRLGFIMRSHTTGPEGSVFGPMGLYKRRTDNTGHYIDPYTNMPAFSTFGYMVEFSKKFMRADIEGMNDYMWDDEYFLGLGFVDSSFVGVNGEVYPAIIAFSRLEKTPVSLQNLWNDFISTRGNDPMYDFWRDSVNFDDDVYVFGPNYPDDTYWLETYDKSKQLNLMNGRDLASVNESARIYIFERNVG